MNTLYVVEWSLSVGTERLVLNILSYKLVDTGLNRSSEVRTTVTTPIRKLSSLARPSQEYFGKTTNSVPYKKSRV